MFEIFFFSFSLQQNRHTKTKKNKQKKKKEYLKTNNKKTNEIKKKIEN